MTYAHEEEERIESLEARGKPARSGDEGVVGLHIAVHQILEFAIEARLHLQRANGHESCKKKVQVGHEMRKSQD